MRSIALFSNKKDSKQAAADIVEQSHERLDFKPDLALFYATLKYNGRYQSMLDIFHREYGDIPQIGASVDGMIYPDDMHTDGAALVLCKDEDAKISVDGVKQKGAVESAEELARKVKCENGAIILHYPLMHVPSILKSGEFYAKGLYYSKQCAGRNQETQKEYARKFSKYCDRENFIYQPPSILSIFARHTDYKIPILCISAMHTQVRFNSPHVFSNFKDINGGIAALTIEKKDLNAIYNDIFPEKGNTLEETKRIISGEFTIIKEFKAHFEKNILISLNGMPPVQAVKDLIYVSQEKKEDLLDHLDKGDYNLYRPYVLLFFNKKTNGVFVLGIGSYVPFDLFPFFMDVSDYSEDVALAYAPVGDKFGEFVSCLNNLKCNGDRFVYFFVDVGVAAAFGKKIFEYKDKIKGLAGKNYLGILSISPSAYIPPAFKLRNYLSESLSNTFFMTGGTNACLEI